MASNFNATESVTWNISGIIPESGSSDDDMGSDTAPYNPLLTGLRTCFAVLTSFAIIAGNIFSLIVMKSIDSPRFPPCTKVFLCNVILSDLAYGLCSALFIGPAALNYWPYGDFLCNATNFIETWICTCCVNATIFITLDRLLAVIYPLRHAAIVPGKRAMIIVTVAVTFAFGFTLAVFMGIKVTYNNNAIMCLVRWSNGTNPYLVRLIMLGCYTAFIPSMILIVCYTKLYLVARKQANLHAKLRNKNGARSADRSNIRALKMCSLITGTFCIAWIPYIVISIRNYTVKKEAPPLVDFIINWLCICNSWWDVIVYFFMAKEFRKTALRLVYRRQSGKNNRSNRHNPTVKCTHTKNF